jgi:hypothetical protein
MYSCVCIYVIYIYVHGHTPVFDDTLEVLVVKDLNGRVTQLEVLVYEDLIY